MAEDIASIGLSFNPAQALQNARAFGQELRNLNSSAVHSQQSMDGLTAAIRSLENAMRPLTPEAQRAAKAEEDLAKANAAAAKATREAIAAVKDKGISLSGLDSQLSTTTGNIKNLVVAWASYHTILSAGNYIVNATNETKALSGAFEGITGNARSGGQALDFVRQNANRLGQSMSPLADGFKTISAAAKDTTAEGDKARNIFLGITESASVLRLSSEQIQGALLAVGQAISKGTVMAEEWRGQLSERLPIATAAATKALGVTTAEFFKMMEAGQLGIDFLDKWATQVRTDFADKVASASDTAMAAWNRFWNAIKHAASEAGSVIDRFSPVLNFLAQVVEKTAQAAENYRKMRGEQDAALRAETSGLPGGDQARLQQLRTSVANRENNLQIFQDTGIAPISYWDRLRGRSYNPDAERAAIAAERAQIQQLLSSASGLRARSGFEDMSPDTYAGLANIPYRDNGLMRVPEQFRDIVYRASQQYTLDPAMLAAMLEAEAKKWDPRSVSPAGAQGLAQLMPITQREMGVTDPFNPWQSIYGGAGYLRKQLDAFGGYPGALAAYNMGPDAYRNAMGPGGRGLPEETQKYLSRIANFYQLNTNGGGGSLSSYVGDDNNAALKSDEEYAKATVDQFKRQLGEKSVAAKEFWEDYAAFQETWLEASRRYTQEADEKGAAMLESLRDKTAELTMSKKDYFDYTLEKLGIEGKLLEDLRKGYQDLEDAQKATSTESEAQEAINALRRDPKNKIGLFPTQEAEEWEKWRSAGESAIDDIAGRLADAAATGKLDWQSFLNSIISGFIRLGTQRLLMSAFNSETGQNVWGAIGKGIGTLSGSPAGAGAAFGNYDVTPGVAIPVGEREPEYFIPRVPGAVIPASRMGDGGGMVVNVHFHGVTDMGSYSRSRGSIQQDIAMTVDRARRNS